MKCKLILKKWKKTFFCRLNFSLKFFINVTFWFNTCEDQINDTCVGVCIEKPHKRSTTIHRHGRFRRNVVESEMSTRCYVISSIFRRFIALDCFFNECVSFFLDARNGLLFIHANKGRIIYSLEVHKLFFHPVQQFLEIKF